MITKLDLSISFNEVEEVNFYPEARKIELKLESGSTILLDEETVFRMAKRVMDSWPEKVEKNRNVDFNQLKFK